MTAAVWVALVAAGVALVQATFSIVQKWKELRWKQAELARELINNWFDWEGSKIALSMVDEGEGDYTLAGYGTYHVNPEIDIPQALGLTQDGPKTRPISNTPKDRLIRKCFDVLFFNFARVEQSIDIGVAKREDVIVPAEYYVAQLAVYKRVIVPYVEFSGFTNGLKFVRYFPSWHASI